MLAKAGLDIAALECGAHWPSNEAAMHALVRAAAAPGALHNNCSGKHAGFVCLGCAMRGTQDAADFVRGYVHPDHPVMREVGAALQATTGFNLAHSARGTDGCSIPTYAIPLRHLAQAFARVATGEGLSSEHARAAARLRRAIAAAPFMVGGSARLDTRLMQHFGDRVCCKVGAEGVYCAALPTLGLGLAIKMDDGNNARAVEVVLAALLSQLLRAEGADAGFLRGVCDAPLRNWNGIEVGRLRATAPWLSA
jgi:L-asparaginase II